MLDFVRRGARLARGELPLAGLALLAFTACKSRPSEASPKPAASVKVAVPAAPRSREKPQLLHGSERQGPLEQYVQQAVEEADASGMRVLVYVGATWCEPCQRFHRALASGQLDQVLAGTKFIEFDLDRDRPELTAAGYTSHFIPLFSVPDSNGHASGRSIEGSVKGEQAVRDNLVPRLLTLLDTGSGESGR